MATSIEKPPLSRPPINVPAGTFVDEAGFTLDPEAAQKNLREGEGGGPRSDTIAGGFQGFRGVAQITQAAGDLNVVNNMLAVSVVAVALPTVAP